MAGFLDAAERVIDMVLTDTGKALLMKGDLRFVYWVPFDDEVNYTPTFPSSSIHDGQSEEQRRVELVESPLVREATMGYRGLNMVEEDLTNLQRPMFTADPGVGHIAPLPTMIVDQADLSVQVSQRKIVSEYEIMGEMIETDAGYQRYESSQAISTPSYLTGSFASGTVPDGFLITVYQSMSGSAADYWNGIYTMSGSGRYQEVVHNRDSNGDVVYKNDLKIKVIS